MERSSPQAWNRPAPSSETLVPGKRDGWPLADRTHDGKRVWHEGSGCRPANALRRSFVAINRLWVERPVYAHLSRVGSRSSRAVLPICGRSFVASLLHQLSAGYRRGQFQVPGNELKHGAADRRDHRRLRSSAWTEALTEKIMAVV